MFQGIAHRTIVQMCTTEPDLSAERPSCGLSSSRNGAALLLSSFWTFIFLMPCLFASSLISIFYASCLLDAWCYKPSCGLSSVQNRAALLLSLSLFFSFYTSGLLQYATRLDAVCPVPGIEQQACSRGHFPEFHHCWCGCQGCKKSWINEYQSVSRKLIINSWINDWIR